MRRKEGWVAEGRLTGLVVDGWMGGWRMESDSESMERGVGRIELGELGSRTVDGWTTVDARVA